ncbi:hypothetical protein CK203_087581 [Vitis vinifera]|uniref:Uncharacterized protein n=1 Tax=Vitis vinifera TaxID=29760 RepID=A0A438EZP4_VITVI|nr:hypothetical protein CK203_087581 [Vitis vinifera]
MREILERKAKKKKKEKGELWGGVKDIRDRCGGEAGQNSSRYCGEQGRGFILGPSGADECRSLPG